MYMSYCRYEGTRNELAACLSDAERHIYGKAEYEVSYNEVEQFKRMVEEFYYFMQEHDLIKDNGELDGVKLDRIGEKMLKAYSQEWEEW